MKRRTVVVAATAIIAASCSGSAVTTDSNSIDIFGPYLDQEAEAFIDAMSQFEFETGVRVNYTGSANFVNDLERRVQSVVDRPDIAMVPQPAVVDELIAANAIVPLSQETVDAVGANYNVDGLDITNGNHAVPYRSSIKSVVWYRPDVFAERQLMVPETFDELVSTVEVIDSTTDLAPWCFSVFSGSATGWPATDWVEDIVLRRAGADAYDEWVRGERAFDDPAIRDAFLEFEELVLTRGRSAGGLRSILNVEVANTSDPLFTKPAGCAMFKQASFAESWFPSGTEVGPDGDVDFFILPATERGQPDPLVIGGDGAVQFDDRETVNQLMTYLATPAGAAEWADNGAFVSARTAVDHDSYYDGASRRLSELLTDAPVSRFDASDVMPAAVGSGLLWTQITAWIAGTITLDELITSVDEGLETARGR
jgi:alpha-glucoside transport system substrate-binding protein